LCAKLEGNPAKTRHQRGGAPGMYPLPEQPEPKPATLRQLPDTHSTAPVPLSAPLPNMPLSAPLAGDYVLPGGGRAAQAQPPEPDRDPAAAAAPPPVAVPPQGWTASGDSQRERIRDDMAGLRARAGAASSWLESSRHYSRLLNRDGIVPVTARMTAGDLAFLAEAREQMLQFTEFTMRLIDLHQPLDAGGISSDPASPIQRCRSCMWRWPCPTFSIVAEVVDRPGAA
jgi:hypothetical protein